MMKDFSNLNNLPAEVKLLIVKGQTLIEDANKTLNDRTNNFDLTSKRELKADCKQVEKYIQLIEKGKITEKNIMALEKSVVKLQTILTGLISFFSR